MIKEKNIIKITQKQNNIVFFFDVNEFDTAIIDILVKEYKDNIRFSPGTEPYITLKNKEDNLIQFNAQINNLNTSLKSLDAKNEELSQTINRIQNELTITSNNLSKERAIRTNCEHSIEDLESEIKAKVQEIKTMTDENDNLKISLSNLSQDRDQLLSEIEKFKCHIMILTKSNKELMDELASIIERDDQ